MEGLVFFFLVTCLTGDPTMVSREKKKEVSRVREKLKARPWLAGQCLAKGQTLGCHRGGDTITHCNFYYLKIR